MKPFKSVAALVLALSCFLWAAPSPEANTGQKLYLKEMAEITGENGSQFAGRHSIAEWEALMAGRAERFVKQYVQQFPALKPYFESERFEKHLPYLRAFFREWANDSGNFGACCSG